MGVFKIKRTPFLPIVPDESEWKHFERILKWRRSIITVFKQLSEEIYDTVKDVERAAPAGYVFIPTTEMEQVNGTWNTVANQVDQPYNFLTRNITSNLNDSMAANIFLTSGTYDVKLLYDKGVSRGIIQVSIGDVIAGNVDMYNAANTYNHWSTFSNVVIGESNEHTVKLEVIGKNASSSDYWAQVTCLTLRKTA
jgi:hypothetical protein